MSTIRMILGDQLSRKISSLNEADKTKDIVFMCEVRNEATYVKHHKKKIAFIFSAMRHFAKELSDEGFNVEYTTLDAVENTGNFSDELKRIARKHSAGQIIITHPSEHRVLNEFLNCQKDLPCRINILPDCRFLSCIDSFKKWAQGKHSLKMEYFYRNMRKKYSILMDNNEPTGGKWNYDADNRKPAPKKLTVPEPFQIEQDKITTDVINLVNSQFSNHFGDLSGIHYAVTRKDALEALQHFITYRLIVFGDYQDVMLEGEPWMYHSHISFYLNCGLLLPLECIQAAEIAYRQNTAPLNSVEGFIRQILGWREYVRGIYWLKMPKYRDENFLNSSKKLPSFFWTGHTRMNCVKQCITETRQNAYAHHIQRLMVIGNFALLAGLHPKWVNEWFLIVYIDAYEWVELPNVTGMSLFADGGFLASKPYASSGNYISKMSNYCNNCHYNVKDKHGETACPFNYLYWDFLSRNRDKLSCNHRLNMIYKTYDKFSGDKQEQIKADSVSFFSSIV